MLACNLGFVQVVRYLFNSTHEDIWCPLGVGMVLSYPLKAGLDGPVCYRVPSLTTRLALTTRAQKGCVILCVAA